MNKTIIFLSIFLLFQSLTFSQGDGDSQFRLAQSYEANGDLENAARIYTELFKIKKNQSYFDGIVRTYLGLSRFSELEEYVKERLQTVENEDLYNLHAFLKYKIGEIDEAKNIWKKVLEKYPDKPEKFEKIADSQSKLQRTDLAVETLLLGRDQIGNPRLFSEQLTKFYIAEGNYRNGFDEVISGLNKTRDIALAQGQLFALMNNSESIKYIGDKLSSLAETNKRDLMIQMLYKFFLSNTGKLQNALDVTVRIDDLRNARGREIMSFATTARQDGNFPTALKAYSILIDDEKYRKYVVSALYGYARTLEEMTVTKSNFKKEEIREIIDRYEQIIRDHKQQSNAAESHLRIAILAQDYLNDIELAEQQLDQILRQFPHSIQAATALVRLGDISLLRGDLKQATKYFNDLERRFKNSATQKSMLGRYKLAMIQYYQGNIDSAKTIFTQLGSESESEVANNSLEKILIIESNKELTLALKKFAEAEYALFRNDQKKALELFDECVKLAEGEDLAQRALFQTAMIKFKNKKYSEVRNTLNQLLDKYPETILGDHATFLIARTYLAEKNKENASKALSDLLVKYPRSIHLKEARDIIRKLRKNEYFQ